MKAEIRNKVELSGFIGQNPEVRTFDNGIKKASFSLATNDGYKSKSGEWVNITNWHNIIAFGKAVEQIEQKVKKGSKVSVEGKINYREYTDKLGVKRNVTEISVFQVQIID
jgi:single-strand DNA-binding protein